MPSTAYSDAITALLNQGIEAYVAGNVAGALEVFNKAIQHYPQSAEAHMERGNLYAVISNVKQALNDYKEAIRLKPELALAYIKRGSLYHKQGQLDDALFDYNEAIRLGVSDPALHNNRGELHFELGRFADALSDFQKAYKERPEDILIRAGLAVSYHAMDEVEPAKELWKSLIEFDFRYKKWNWVGKELSWHKSLVDEAKKIIKAL